MKIIHNIKAPIGLPEEEIIKNIKQKYGLSENTFCKINKKSFDCRHKNVSAVYSVIVDTDIKNDDFTEIKEYNFTPPKKLNTNIKPVIVGMGPAGLFCAKTLSDYGISPIIIDRGKPVEERIKDIENFWSGKNLNEESNVQFGEGGAGTFSDGKLTCRKNDPRTQKILETFVSYGAPEDILTNALPHIGTDILRKVIVNMRNDLISKGVEFIYNSKLTDIVLNKGKITKIITTSGEIPCEILVLAIGNGSFDTFSMLLKKDVVTETKPISVGIRQEHLQSDINKAIYGKFSDNPILPPASYSYYKHLDKETCVYTFCMCPGGQVVNASSISGRLTTNGMSEYKRDNKNANSALLVTVNPSSVNNAMEIQKTIEENAFSLYNGAFPVSTDFHGKNNIKTSVKPTVLPNYEFADFEKIFPEKFVKALETGSDLFNKHIFDFNFEKPVFTAPETRTSAPLRLKRDNDSLIAIGTDNLYPSGEGAGYAGGIMSSAIDGMKTAEAIITKNGETM